MLRMFKLSPEVLGPERYRSENPARSGELGASATLEIWREASGAEFRASDRPRLGTKVGPIVYH